MMYYWFMFTNIWREKSWQEQIFNTHSSISHFDKIVILLHSLGSVTSQHGVLYSYWKHQHILHSQHDQKRQHWWPWTCWGHTCREHSSHAKPPHRMDCDPAKRITVIIISASDGKSYPIKQTVILPKEDNNCYYYQCLWQNYPIKWTVILPKE